MDHPTTTISMRAIKRQVLGLDLLRQLGERHRRVFELDEVVALAKEAKLSQKDVVDALSQLEQEGWIATIRRGTFAIINALPTTDAAHAYEIAASLVTPAALSHWTALQHHGIAIKPSPYIYVLTHTAPSLPRYRRKASAHPKEIYPVANYSFRFVQIKPTKFFGIEQRQEGAVQISLTDLERTLWDAVAMPQHCGGWANVEASFYAAKASLRLPRLIEYALKGDTATAKRLGWLLEYHGRDPDELTPLLQLPIKGFRLLDASAPAGGPCNTRWMIQVNTLRM